MPVPTDHPFFKTLLDWSVQHTDEQVFEDGNFTPLSAADQTFLEEALASCSLNVTDVIKRHVATLSELDTPQNEDTKADVLEALADICEDIDFARDLHQCGGLLIVIRYLTHSNTQLRMHAARVCMVVTQNHPEMQEAAMEYKLLDNLLGLWPAERDEGTLGSVVSAVSALVRGFDPAEREFLRRGGMGLCVQALGARNPRVVKRALFLLKSVSETNSAATKQGVDAGLVGGVVRALTACPGDADLWEKGLVTLRTALYQHPDVVRPALRSEGLGGHWERARGAVAAEDVEAWTEADATIDAIRKDL